jgi:hypothetical protein
VTGPGEPHETIYTPVWASARARLSQVEPEEVRTLLSSAMDHVESGWPPLRALQLWANDYPERQRGNDGYGLLLTFGDAEVREAFGSLARGLANLVTLWPRSEPPHTSDDLAGQLDVFVRYATVLALAVGSANIPAGYTVLVRDVAHLRGPWASKLGEILDSIGEHAIADFACEALEVLVQGLPEAEQDRVSGLLAVEVQKLYASVGQSLPPWLRLVGSYFNIYGSGAQ